MAEEVIVSGHSGDDRQCGDDTVAFVANDGSR